jgi:hypothetical protein
MAASLKRLKRGRPAFLGALAALAVGGLCGMASPASAQPAASGPRASSDWVSYSNGKLSYRQDAQGNQVPDFSSVGYHGGDASIPSPPVVATVSPTFHGDDTARIQTAIDHAKAGAVLLQTGTYRIGGTIRLNRSGIVLRGSQGTVLKGTGSAHTVIAVGGKGAAGIRKTSSSHPVTDTYVPAGSPLVHVKGASSSFRKGDRIVVQRPMEAQWIHAIGMDRIPHRPDGGRTVQWKPYSGIYYERTVAAVQGNAITLDAPLPQALEKQYTHATVSKYTYPGRISEVGVENLTGDGNAFRSKSTFRSTGYFRSTMVSVDAAENSWVRNVTARRLSAAFQTGAGALHVSISHTQSLDPGVPQDIHAPPAAYSIGGQQTLISDCHLTGSNQHAWVTQARVPGPNVVTKCSAIVTGARPMDAGPHQRWATGTLYDEISMSGGGTLSIDDRRWLGSGQGWAGANSVAWNCSVGRYKVEEPPTAHNWAIGCTGKQMLPSSGHTMGQIQFPGRHVLPASLYTAQLCARHSKNRIPTPTPVPASSPSPSTSASAPSSKPPPASPQTSTPGPVTDSTTRPASKQTNPLGGLTSTGANAPLGLIGGVAVILVAAGVGLVWWIRRHKAARD